jgi:hypothetical protein
MRVLFVVVICLLLLACSITPIERQTYPVSLQSCVDKLVNFKQQVSRQRVNDAQLIWSAAYPHLAFDRFSLSLINQLNNTSVRTQWLKYVTSQASAQRNIEYSNLTDNSHLDLSAINSCAQQLARDSASDKNWWQRLQLAPPVYPSDYQAWQRILGFYPISKLFAAPAIAAEKRRIRDDFQRMETLNVQGYRPITSSMPTPQQLASWFKESSSSSSLGWTLLTQAQSRDLLNYYAPNWLIGTQSDDDKPGKVGYDINGKAMVDSLQPVMYVYSGYTRFRGKILTQLNYTLWFANRTPTWGFDPYAGKFDAVLIRLTLDQQGQPFILDTIHSCGCYHMVFSLNPTLNFSQPTPAIEHPITMQLTNIVSYHSRISVRLNAKTHMVKGITAHPYDKNSAESSTKFNTENSPPISTEQMAQNNSLTLLPYRQLRSLPYTATTNKSLFDSQGMLMASKRAERWFLWPFGVKSPGAMRQTGHHAIIFIGERHFDDPFIFESLFELD